MINGFGRIGRTVLRQLLRDPAHADIEIAAINDIAPLDMCAYLLRYDSVFGPWPGEVTAEPGHLGVAGRRIPFWQCADLSGRDLAGVDVVLECTGTAHTRPRAEAGIVAGARAVLVSGPSEAADQTIVLGANDGELGHGRIISNASCTTNAIGPLLAALDAALGIEAAHVTTVHCYTGSQPTVDAPGASHERSRAAAVSMVPTTTSAADQVTKVLPGLAGRLSVAAIRVPVISVSTIDATIRLSDCPKGDFNAVLRATFAGSPLVGMIDDPCVSTDLRGREESVILALPETMRIGADQVRIMGWYDNEWGFSARMVDMTRRIAARRDRTRRGR